MVEKIKNPLTLVLVMSVQKLERWGYEDSNEKNVIDHDSETHYILAKFKNELSQPNIPSCHQFR